MGLTEKQRQALEREFLQQDLRRLPYEAPITRIKRELTRALYEDPLAGPERVIGWVVGCLDKVVTAWENPLAHVDQHVTDGVRAAATIIAESAERAGLTMPVQPVPVQPGAAPAGASDGPTSCTSCDADLLLGGVDAERCWFCDAPAKAEPPAGEWTPSDGGATPSMFEEA